MNREVADQHCIKLIQAGGRKREEGVSLLFHAYAAELRRFFTYKCGNRGDADDLVQETFVKIVRSFDSYRGESFLQSWIWTVARHCLTDYFRHKGVHPTENLDDEGWEMLEQVSPHMRVAEVALQGQNVEDCVRQQFTQFAKASPNGAYALTLQMDGYDTRFIAGVLKRSEGATREFLSQCRKKIESFLLPCKDYLAA
jgi:RNA polymerase sigma-70 factor (ECF subfamily)